MAEQIFDLFSFEKSKPKNHIRDYLTLLYAPEKWGKTSFANEFDDAGLLPFEIGYKLLSNIRPICPKTMKVQEKADDGERKKQTFPSDYEGIPDWKWFVKNVVDKFEQAVLAGQRLPIKTLIVDTADRAAKMCKDFVLAREGLAHESDLEWGKGFDYIKEEFDKQMSRLTRLGLGVIFLSHAITKEFKPKNKEPYTKIIPTLSKGARDSLIPMCDFVIYGCTGIDLVDGKQVERRYLNFRESTEFEAGCRLKLMPSKVYFGTNGKEGYDNFLASFRKAFSDEFGEELLTAKEDSSAGKPTIIGVDIAKGNDTSVITPQNTTPPEQKTERSSRRKNRDKDKNDEPPAANNQPKAEPSVQPSEVQNVIPETKPEPEPVKETPPAEQPIEEVKPTEPPKEEVSVLTNDVLVPLTAEENALDLASLIKVLGEKTMALYKNGKMSPVDLSQFISDYTNTNRVSQINDIDKARKLLQAVKGKM